MREHDTIEGSRWGQAHLLLATAATWLFFTELVSSMSGMPNRHMVSFGSCGNYYTLIHAYRKEGGQGCQ